MYICVMKKYIITREGKVVNSTTQKELKQHIDKYGYKRVNLFINNKNTQKQVHRLVAIAFIPNVENKPQVNHINGIKTDNRVENLEWCTNQENRNHAVNNGLHKHQKYEVFKNNISLGIYNSSKIISEKFNLDQSAICKVANGKYKTTKGYKICKVN
jgi:hypothetical protein